MIDQDDAAVVDNHLACKKDDSLEDFVSGMGKANRISKAAVQLHPRTCSKQSRSLQNSLQLLRIEPIPQTYQGE